VLFGIDAGEQREPSASVDVVVRNRDELDDRPPRPRPEEF
jgi:hypothetical protein